MSADVRSRAFEPFFTTKPKDKGTGLGLATVYGIVQQAKGHVAIQSQEGDGTVIEILLPSTDETPTARLRKIRRAPHRGRGETLLVAEDEDALRTMTCRLLSRSGYSVLEARGPGEALLASERHGGKIDLLLTDVVMPQMSGQELAERLVRLRPDLRVMYMSGYANDVIGAQLRDTNVPLLEKPFTEEALLARVREALDGPAS
jgi:CheY-like chemotaxis protein